MKDEVGILHDSIDQGDGDFSVRFDMEKLSDLVVHREDGSIDSKNSFINIRLAVLSGWDELLDIQEQMRPGSTAQFRAS